MKRKYKYIHFAQGGKLIWDIINNKTDNSIGMIIWYPSTNQFCFFPQGNIVLNMDCLLDIIDFIDQLEKEKKRDLKRAIKEEQ